MYIFFQALCWGIIAFGIASLLHLVINVFTWFKLQQCILELIKYEMSTISVSRCPRNCFLTPVDTKFFRAGTDSTEDHCSDLIAKQGQSSDRSWIQILSESSCLPVHQRRRLHRWGQWSTPWLRSLDDPSLALSRTPAW